MTGAVFWFDLKQRIKRVGFLAYFLLFTASSCFLFMAAAGAFPSVNIGLSTGGKVLTNSPFTLHSLIMTYCVFSVQLTAAAMGQAIFQDHQHQTAALFFVTPLRRREYLLGRYLAALAYLVILFSSFGLGFFLGSLMPGVEKSLIGPNRAAAYLMPYLTGVLPNQIIAGSLFFALAARTRKMRGVYTISVVLLAAYLVAGSIEVQVEYKWLAGLLDPFGTYASQYLAEYWSIAEKNTRLVTATGMLLINRLAWMALSVTATVAMLWKLRLGHPEESDGSRIVDRDDARVASAQALPLPVLTHRQPPSITLLGSLSWLLFRDTVRNVYFVVMALSAVGFFVAAAQNLGSMYGTTTYPVTYQIVELAAGSFGLFNLIVIIYFSGELVWRERDSKVDQIVDALPTSDWLLPVARLFALAGVLLVLSVVTMLCGLGLQVGKGYFKFELSVYLIELFAIGFVHNLLLGVLALFVQSLVRSKTTGHSLMIGYYVVMILLRRFDYEHPLYRYASTPGSEYSDMNGWGHFLMPVTWFNLYWGAIAGVLMVGAVLLGTRGKEDGWKFRGRFAKQRLTWGTLAALVLLIGGAFGLGGFLFYNTNRLHRYLGSVDKRHLRGEYERRYKALATVPQPHVTKIDVRYHLQPKERALGIDARYELENRQTVPVTEVLITINYDAKIDLLEVGGNPLSFRDPEVGFYRIALGKPLLPGDKSELHFVGRYQNPGFPAHDSNDRIVANGTFVDSQSLPGIGYFDELEVSTDDGRRKEKLPAKERMLDLDNPAGKLRSYIGAHADWISVRSTIVTDADQIALAPGSLVSDTTDGPRRTFVYQTDAPVLPFFSMLSARYVVERAQWRDVAIEVYYHPTHQYNIARMIEGVKDTLEYLDATIGPYPHKQVRIVEFPRYESFAQSFPSTIPFSESIGFIAKVDPDNEKDVDYPYYVTAHEVAHQWWANQVVGADVQGATLLSESLSQYTALMVMKKKLGANQMKKFLRYELDRYLMGRSFESKKELPIYRVENQQYIHYQKGTLVTYALADYVGEATFNRGLKAFFEKFRFKAAPYPTSRDLLAALREAIPAEQHALLVDWFEQITLYSVRCDEAKLKQRADGKYEVTIEVSVEKTRSDELGEEKPAPITEPFDVGVLGKKGKVLALEKYPIPTGKGTFTLVVDEKPERAGIDPLHKLIDRVPDDNTRPVK